MNSPPFRFELLHQDADTAARRSVFHTPHGPVQLPTFMPVGTLGTVKGLQIDSVRATGAEMILGNTYHLALRPGERVVAELGGLHEFSGWQGPILTDSGGFQLFSLAQLTKIREEGAEFRSHIDGSTLHLSPERSIEIQETLGSDVAMVLDHVIKLPSDAAAIREATERTIRWAARCLASAQRPSQTQFGIVQGGLDPALRVDCAARLSEMPFGGFAIGGLSVGETPAQMYEIVEVTTPVLPQDKPRYLMGVGRPQDLLEAVHRGVDMFDCVMPTRNGRNALAFTDQGPLRMRNQCHTNDKRPIEDGCPCPACRHSRGYIRHLFRAEEMLGPILVSAHNLTYYARLMADARTAIEQDHFSAFYHQRMRGWGETPHPSAN